MVVKMNEIKTELYQKCKEALSNKRVTLEKRLQGVQNSLTSESKSTAGDKHETGRAMLQLEREKLGSQLKELENQENLLHKIQLKEDIQICLGSCILTDNLNYYLSISIGEIKLAKESFYAISAQSPIGQLLIGKKTGDQISFNGKTSTILQVY